MASKYLEGKIRQTLDSNKKNSIPRYIDANHLIERIRKMHYPSVPIEVLMSEPTVNAIPLPCAKGTRLYRIQKCCDEYYGFKPEYKPVKEFKDKCYYCEEGYWDTPPSCNYCDREYPELDLEIQCPHCLDRFTIVPILFEYSMMERIVGTEMYDNATSPEHRLYLTLEEAQAALEKIVLEWRDNRK